MKVTYEQNILRIDFPEDLSHEISAKDIEEIKEIKEKYQNPKTFVTGFVSTPKDSSYLFADTDFDITGLIFDMSKTTKADGMFKNSALPALPALLKTDSLISINEMFKECHNLKNLEYLYINIDSVKYAEELFDSCENLEFASVQIRSLRKAPYMFRNCTNLKKAVVYTPLLENASGLFQNCFNLEEIKTSFGNLKNVDSMFEMCQKLKHIPFTINKTIPKFPKANIQDITNFNRMFYKTKSFEDYDKVSVNMAESLIECFYDSNVTDDYIRTIWFSMLTKHIDATKAFANCNRLVGNFNFDLRENLYAPHIFENCENLSRLPLEHTLTINMEHSYNFDSAFKNTNIKNIDLLIAAGNYQRKSNLNLSSMFEGIEALETAHLSVLYFENENKDVLPITLIDIFKDCPNLKDAYIDLPTLSTTHLGSAFENDNSLTSAKLYPMYNAKHLEKTFKNCTALESINQGCIQIGTKSSKECLKNVNLKDRHSLIYVNTKPTPLETFGIDSKDDFPENCYVLTHKVEYKGFALDVIGGEIDVYDF